MAVSKVIVNGVVKVDLTDDTVTAASLLSGITATGANGVEVSGSITSKSAATYTPGTTNQTIASGQYLSGAQTISGDANLIASNIMSGVTIFGVTGTASGDEITPMTEQEIWEAATEGWGVNAVMTDAQIHTAVDNGWG